MTKVIINGSKGNMGKAALKAVTKEPSLNLIAALDKDDNLEQVLKNTPADVTIDLTHPSCVFENVQTILKNNSHAVVGTTGLSQDQLTQCDTLAKKQNKSVIVCPNFAIGAILMMRFATQAAKYFDRCEIIEYHHDKKADAPSGTAIKTAELISNSVPEINSIELKEEELIKGARGANKNNIEIHSVRIPGVVANQDVIFGALGQSMTIKHETISRDAFMPGLILAVKAAPNKKGLIYGLEHLLD